MWNETTVSWVGAYLHNRSIDSPAQRVFAAVWYSWFFSFSRNGWTQIDNCLHLKSMAHLRTVLYVSNKLVFVKLTKSITKITLVASPRSCRMCLIWSCLRKSTTHRSTNAMPNSRWFCSWNVKSLADFISCCEPVNWNNISTVKTLQFAY